MSKDKSEGKQKVMVSDYDEQLSKIVRDNEQNVECEENSILAYVENEILFNQQNQISNEISLSKEKQEEWFMSNHSENSLKKTFEASDPDKRREYI